MDILAKLFGSQARVKMLRLFLFNKDEVLDSESISGRAKIPIALVRKELGAMEKIQLIKRRSFFKDVERKKGGKKVIVKKRTQGWTLDESFLYIEPLQEFFIQTATLHEKDVLGKLRKAGKLKLVIVAGVFIREFDNRIDMLIVGDSINNKKLESAVKDIEAEVGMELKYSFFSTNDFKYRLEMRDRLVRDILDYPHKTLVDRISVQYTPAN